MIGWWEHFIDWALKFYWMSSICLTLFLASPNPHRTTVSSSCWWDTQITQRMRPQSLRTVMMGTFGRWLASDQPGLERNRPLERDTASISALACDSPAKYSSGNHSLFLYLASPPLHWRKRELFYVPMVWDLVRPPWPPSPRIINVVAARGIAHHTTLLFKTAGAALTLSGCSQASSL